jgi:hypothetical protein
LRSLTISEVTFSKTWRRFRTISWSKLAR